MAAIWPFVCCIAVCLGSDVTGTYHDDEIHNLPGLPGKPDFKHYSGYLKSSETRRLHYWLTEAEHEPQRAPLVVWLNGGPGCSSLNGLFTENGPYLANDDGMTLRYNDFSWNKVANVLFLESPAGVGYSYATDRKYETGDDQTADDSYRAIVYFYKKFPHYKGRELVISGESYAGVYIPTLMDRFLNDSNINLKGAMIGNGLLANPGEFIQTNIYLFHFYALLSDSAYREMQRLCCDGRQSEEECHYFPPKNLPCAYKVSTEVLKIMQLPINRYNIYAPCVVTSSEQARTNRVSKRWAAEALTLTFKQLQGQNITENVRRLQKISAQEEESSFVPCVPAEGTKLYLRRDDVREAIHMLPNTVTGLPDWNGCSSLVDDDTGTYHSNYFSQLDVLERLVASKKYNIMLYYGDQDFMCSMLTGRSVFHEVAKRLSLQHVSEHRAWYYTATDGSPQVGGFMESYDRFLYLTFKGSGHMVPTDVPRQSLDILKRYLSGDLFRK